MALNNAQCRIRIQPNSDIKEEQIASEDDLVFVQPDHADSETPALSNLPLLENTNSSEISTETRLKWVKEVTEAFLGASKAVRSARVRDFDLILKPDGSIDILVHDSSDTAGEKAQLRTYPARYQIPKSVIDKISPVEEQIKRTELFALGCILYELISGNTLFAELDDETIQTRYAKGEFPDDVWGLSKAVRILACWCPDIAKQLLGARGNDNIREKFVKYVQKHPVLFGFQVLGGVASIASLAALPVLGAIGFGTLGPAAGSAAAGWQASLGLVEAGSLFAWCQSAAMGGAAVGGILATGLGGAGVAIGASVAGALDVAAGEKQTPDLKERFLTAWKLQTADDAAKEQIMVVEVDRKEEVKGAAKADVKTKILRILRL
ncbi:hypothetical protein LOCC1_G004604 [Lachnellula occidentalis]|uniref:Protein kinase domain-containing protein n=1 Tax=Lachnellula occidentalis TaxID=215460 RepID=A0A8H8UFQ2_9HELO|nr:hypothetical protein LOCC1_G004604 [Lachnellula occidentalis]